MSKTALSKTQITVLRHLREGADLAYHPSHGTFDPGGYHWWGFSTRVSNPKRSTMDALRRMGLVGFRKLTEEERRSFAPVRKVILTKEGFDTIEAILATEEEKKEQE